MPVKAQAKLRFVSIPPRKMRLVANMVKGLPIEKALDILNFTPKIAANHIASTVKSAAANALSSEGTAHLNPENLFIKNITVDTAPSMKRIRFYAQGRAHQYKKRHSHLTVILEEMESKHVEEVEEKATADKPAAKKTAVKKTAKKVATKKTAKKTAAKTTKKKTTARKKTTTVKKTSTKKTVTKRTSSTKNK